MNTQTSLPLGQGTTQVPDFNQEILKSIPKKKVLKSVKQQKYERKVELERLFKTTLGLVENMTFFDEDLILRLPEEVEQFKQVHPDEWNKNPRIKLYAEELYAVHCLNIAEQFRRINNDKARAIYLLNITEKEMNGIPNPNYCMSKDELVLWVRIFNKLFQI